MLAERAKVCARYIGIFQAGYEAWSCRKICGQDRNQGSIGLRRLLIDTMHLRKGK